MYFFLHNSPLKNWRDLSSYRPCDRLIITHPVNYNGLPITNGKKSVSQKALKVGGG